MQALDKSVKRPRAPFTTERFEVDLPPTAASPVSGIAAVRVPVPAVSSRYRKNNNLISIIISFFHIDFFVVVTLVNCYLVLILLLNSIYGASAKPLSSMLMSFEPRHTPAAAVAPVSSSSDVPSLPASVSTGLPTLSQATSISSVPITAAASQSITATTTSSQSIPVTAAARTSLAPPPPIGMRLSDEDFGGVTIPGTPSGQDIPLISPIAHVQLSAEDIADSKKEHLRKSGV